VWEWQRLHNSTAVSVLLPRILSWIQCGAVGRDRRNREQAPATKLKETLAKQPGLCMTVYGAYGTYLLCYPSRHMTLTIRLHEVNASRIFKFSVTLWRPLEANVFPQWSRRSRKHDTSCSVCLCRKTNKPSSRQAVKPGSVHLLQAPRPQYFQLVCLNADSVAESFSSSFPNITLPLPSTLLPPSPNMHFLPNFLFILPLAAAASAVSCNHDNCYREIIAYESKTAPAFCSVYLAAT